jgi:glutamate-1-semialdehyde 2,1-aminomutase
MGIMRVAVSEKAVIELLAREKASFSRCNPKSKALSERAQRNWLRGVPMHWMVDWGTPFNLFINSAQGIDLTDADGNSYIDFCLGDTGAMFGHSPKAIAETLANAGASGLTTMLPSEDAVEVGALLEDRFGLPFWQVTATASDANRAVLRWCRAITNRKKILIFNHCYHGCVDDTFVTADHGKMKMVDGLVGEPRELTQYTKIVEFNDVPALEKALAGNEVACVLAEPVMTNVGMVLPQPGFLAALRDLTAKTGTLLILDETHTLSTHCRWYSRCRLWFFCRNSRTHPCVPRSQWRRPIRHWHNTFRITHSIGTDQNRSRKLHDKGGLCPCDRAGTQA